MKREVRHGQVDEVFREGLSDLNVTPPADIWKTVKSAIPGRKKGRYLTVFRLAAATLLLLILTGSLWLIYLKKPSDRDLADQPVFPVKNSDTDIPAATRGEHVTPPAPGPEKGITAAARERLAEHRKMASEKKEEEQVPPREPLQCAALLTRLPGTTVSSGRLVLPGRKVHAANMDYTATLLNTPSNPLDLGPVAPGIVSSPKHTITWGIGGDFGPVFSYRNLPYKTEYTRFLDDQEAGALSYGGNLSFFVRRKKRLSIQSGIGYYHTGQVSKDMVAFRQVKSGNLALLESKGNNYLYTSGGVPGYDHVPLFIANRLDPAGNDQTEYILTFLGKGLYEPVDAQLKLDYEFVEVPLLLRYRIIDRAFGVNVTGGLAASMLFHSAASVLTADGETTTLGEIDGLRRTNFNSTVGVGVSYRISQDFLFRVEPTFKYYINPVSENDGIDTHPFLFGIYSGLSIFF